MKCTIWFLSQNFHQIMCFQKHGPMKWNIIIQGLPPAYKLVWILEGNWREYLGYSWMLLWRHCLRYRWCKVLCAGCDGDSSFYLCLPACAERHRPGQKQLCKNPNSPLHYYRTNRSGTQQFRISPSSTFIWNTDQWKIHHMQRQRWLLCILSRFWYLSSQ